MNQEKRTVELTKEEARSMATAIMNRKIAIWKMKTGEKNENIIRYCDKEEQLLDNLYPQILRASI